MNSLLVFLTRRLEIKFCRKSFRHDSLNYALWNDEDTRIINIMRIIMRFRALAPITRTEHNFQTAHNKTFVVSNILFRFALFADFISSDEKATRFRSCEIEKERRVCIYTRNHRFLLLFWIPARVCKVIFIF